MKKMQGVKIERFGTATNIKRLQYNQMSKKHFHIFLILKWKLCDPTLKKIKILEDEEVWIRKIFFTN